MKTSSDCRPADGVYSPESSVGAGTGADTRLGRCQCGCGRLVRMAENAPWARSPECNQARDRRLERKRDEARLATKLLAAIRPTSRPCARCGTEIPQRTSGQGRQAVVCGGCIKAARNARSRCRKKCLRAVHKSAFAELFGMKKP